MKTRLTDSRSKIAAPLISVVAVVYGGNSRPDARILWLWAAFLAMFLVEERKEKKL
jgi:hypothetical protein